LKGQSYTIFNDKIGRCQIIDALMRDFR